MAHLVDSLYYYPECRGFDPQLGNLSTRTMALGSTQLLTEMISRDITGG